MARETSIAVLRQIEAEGLVGELQIRVLRALIENGPSTGRELDGATRLNGSWKRLSELKRMGAVREVKIRPCRVTGRDVYEWDLTDQLPNPDAEPLRRRTRKSLEEEIADLRALIERTERWLKLNGHGQIAVKVREVLAQLQEKFDGIGEGKGKAVSCVPQSSSSPRQGGETLVRHTKH